MTTSQSLRHLAAEIGRYRFHSADSLIDFHNALRKQLLSLANDIDRRPSECTATQERPSIVDKYLGRRPSYGIHVMNGRPVVVEKKRS